MAATAGSVAVGSTIGHGLSNMLFGGRSEAAPEPVAQAQPVAQQNAQAMSCDVQAKRQFSLKLEFCQIGLTGYFHLRVYPMPRKGRSPKLHLVP